MRGCIDCKHHQSKLHFEPKIHTTQSCAIGNDEVCKNWWDVNGHKTEKSDFVSPECAELTDGSKMLQSMIDATKELTELLTQ